MNVYEAHAASLLSLQDELGSDCPAMVFGGQTIKILPGGVRTRKDLVPGGFSLDTDIQLTCLLADFATAPEPRQTFTYAGRAFRIESVTTMAGERQVRIGANHLTK